MRKEAVRAIHDVPQLHSQMPALAELTVTSDSDDAVVSRVLNASFRLGRDQDAARLADFAASSACKDSLRVEALDMLSDWAKPGNRDRIMNRHQPLKDRDPAIAKNALRERIEALSATPQLVRDKFLEVGAKAGLTEISNIILRTIQDKTLNGARRGAGIKALTSLDPDSIKPMINDLLHDASVEVRMASMAFQVSQTPADATASLKEAIGSKLVRERQFAWDQLGAMSTEAAKSVLSMGVNEYLRGTLERDCWVNVVEAVNGSGKKFEARHSAHECEKLVAVVNREHPQTQPGQHAEHTHDQALPEKHPHHLAVRRPESFHQSDLASLHHDERD